MKATIDESGCLQVSAETALECYALAQWFDGWDKPIGQQTSALKIVITKDQSEQLKGKQ